MKSSSARMRLVVANWKMNPSTLEEAKRLFLDIKRQAVRRARVATVIAPPFVYIPDLAKLAARPVRGRASNGARSAVRIGAQDVFWEKEGAYTGEVSAIQLASVGASHVIVGHSERRVLGETDEQIARKVAAAIGAKLTVVLCVGESERDASGHHLSVVEEQLRRACTGVPKHALRHLTVAYEPVWAISSGDGKGQTASSEDVHEMTIFIKKVLTSIYTRPSADRVPILYGGSVNDENARALIEEGMADGFLVGGASLKPAQFGVILSAAHGISQQ